MSDAPLIVLGCGYVGARVALAAREAGRTVRACARGTGRLAKLAASGVEVKYLDASVPKQVPTAMASLHGATVLYSIPAGAVGPTGLRTAMQAAYGINAGCFIYLSSSGMYGPLPDDEPWIDEDTPIVLDDSTMKNAQVDERTINEQPFPALRTVILRLAPVYGPGRGVRNRMLKGEYKLLDDGSHAISRIHVDDIANVVFACEDKAPNLATYLVADDHPTTQLEYATWLAERLGIPLPPSRDLYDNTGYRITHRNRKIRNARMKEQLGLTLRYPTFREGEVAIEEELARE